MSRRHSAQKREVNPDPKFNDIIITKFMNAVMEQGKKSVAERIVYGALDKIEARAKSDPVQMFHQALENVMPAVEVRSRRVGGSSARPPSGAGDSLDHLGCPRPEREHNGRSALG